MICQASGWAPDELKMCSDDKYTYTDLYLYIYLYIYIYIYIYIVSGWNLTLAAAISGSTSKGKSDSRPFSLHGTQVLSSTNRDRQSLPSNGYGPWTSSEMGNPPSLEWPLAKEQ